MTACVVRNRSIGYAQGDAELIKNHIDSRLAGLQRHLFSGMDHICVLLLALSGISSRSEEMVKNIGL